MVGSLFNVYHCEYHSFSVQVFVSIMHCYKFIRQSSFIPLLLSLSLKVCQQCDHYRGTQKSLTYLGGKMDDVMSPHAAQSRMANGLIRQTTNTHYYYFYYCLSKLLKCCGCEGSIWIVCQPATYICGFSYWTCVTIHMYVAGASVSCAVWSVCEMSVWSIAQISCI